MRLNTRQIFKISSFSCIQKSNNGFGQIRNEISEIINYIKTKIIGIILRVKVRSGSCVNGIFSENGVRIILTWPVMNRGKVEQTDEV